MGFRKVTIFLRVTGSHRRVLQPFLAPAPRGRCYLFEGLAEPLSMQRWSEGVFRERAGNSQANLGSNSQHGSRGPFASATPVSSFLPCPAPPHLCSGMWPLPSCPFLFTDIISPAMLLCLAAMNFFLLFKHPPFSHLLGFTPLFPLPVTPPLPVSTLINSSSFRMASQVTSFRKPSILTPVRLGHQHW